MGTKTPEIKVGIHPSTMSQKGQNIGAWAKAHPEEASKARFAGGTANAIRQKAHPEEVAKAAARLNAWKKAHPEWVAKAAARLNAWRKAHPEQVSQSRSIHRTAFVKAHPEYLNRMRQLSILVIEKYWHIRSPSGVPYEFKNLSRFITNHPELFDSEDLKPRSFRCHAYAGVSRLRPTNTRKKVAGSWKGWTWLSIPERRFNDAQDLLDRHQNSNP